MVVDLNADLGEGAAVDAEIMPLITSANVACGFHAGSPLLARTTLKMAIECGVNIGAHPGYADREHFGRRELPVSPEQVFAECVYQIGALMALAKTVNGRIKYMKPHGGLYHQMCREDAFAQSGIAAAEMFGLTIVGLPGSRMEQLSNGHCPFVAEGFADRRYWDDGSLVPREEPGAFIDDPAEAVAQVDWLIRNRDVRTICIHGDNPHALGFISALRKALFQMGIAIRGF